MPLHEFMVVARSGQWAPASFIFVPHACSQDAVTQKRLFARFG